MNIKHNKAEVIDKGMELFWVNGYHKLGVDAICRGTGMTKGAFYNAFKSKEGFLLTALDAYGTANVEFLHGLLSRAAPNAFDRLVSMYTFMLEVQPDNQFKGCLMNNMMSEMAAANSKVAERASELFSRFVEVIEPVVGEAQADGDLDPKMDTRRLSEVIHTAFLGFLTRSKSLYASTDELMASFLHLLKTKK